MSFQNEKIRTDSKNPIELNASIIVSRFINNVFCYICITNANLYTVMAIIITDECINCGACEAECPNTAIYEGGLEWSFAEGTLSGQIGDIDALTEQEPISYDFYYIVPDKCTECKRLS